MANVRFGNINRTSEATGKGVWDWYTEPEQMAEEKKTGKDNDRKPCCRT